MELFSVNFVFYLVYFCFSVVLSIPVLEKNNDTIIITTQKIPTETTEIEMTTTFMDISFDQDSSSEIESEGGQNITTTTTNPDTMMMTTTTTLETLNEAITEEVTKNIEIITTENPTISSSNISARLLSHIIPFDEEYENDPCSLFPCGARAICEVRHGNRSCSCLDGYYGNPEVKCREQCVLNSDCPEGMACVEVHKTTTGEFFNIRRRKEETRHECVDSCTLDPYEECLDKRKKTKIDENNSVIQESPCSPVENPCGENTWCEEKYGRAICHCEENFYGDPWSVACFPECLRSRDHCPSNQVCIQMKCKNPCLDPICGVGAICQVINYSISCKCPEKSSTDSDPYKKCIPIENFVNDTVVNTTINPLEIVFDS